jgi:hypothetical protein
MVKAQGYGKIPTMQTEAFTIGNDSDLSYCVVWSPLPPITWILPFVGHTGIADSKGVISDFQGPYTVGDRGRMAFGAPTRALKIHTAVAPAHDSESSCTAAAARWDEAIQDANQVYRGRMHNILCDNCHSHVAYALNHAGVKEYGVEKWDMVKLAVLLTFRGRFLSWGAVATSYAPFCILLLLVLIFTGRIFGGK